PFTRETFDGLDFHRSFEIYRDRFADASDFTFYLVGSFDPESLRPLVERYLGGLPSLGRVEQGRDVGMRPPSGVVRRTVRRGMEPKGMTQIVFSGAFDFAREELGALVALAVVLRIRLRAVLREDMGGIYGVAVQASGARDPWSRYTFSIGFGADPHRLEELTAVVFAEIDSLQAHGPREEELAKVREARLRSHETRVRQNHFWLEQRLAHDRYGWDPREILSPGGEGLDAERVRRAATRYLDPANYVQVSLLPEADAEGELAPRGGVYDGSGRK